MTAAIYAAFFLAAAMLARRVSQDLYPPDECELRERLNAACWRTRRIKSRS